MTYTCELCDYTTLRLDHYKKHLKTQKHLKKVKETNKSGSKVFHPYSVGIPKIAKNPNSCLYCYQAFSSKSNLTRHLKYCSARLEAQNNLKQALSEKEKKLKEKDIKLQEKNKEISELKHLVLYFEDLLSMTHRTLDKSVTAISYANMFLTSQQAKPLEEPSKKDLRLLYHNKKYPKNEKEYKKIDFDERQKMYSRKLYDNATYEYAGGTKQLAEYVTDIIVEIYKKEDPKDQAVWNSDSARLNFIIREFIENTDIAKWQKDKKGVKVTKVIIDPIIDELKNVLEKEIVNSSKIMAEKGGFIREEELRRVNRSSKIIKDIDEGVLQNAILKKMAGHFYLNKGTENNNELLEEDNINYHNEGDKLFTKDDLVCSKPEPKWIKDKKKKKNIKH